MAHELRVEPGDGERALERPHRALRVGGRPAGANRLEQALGLDVVPLHGRSIASGADRGFGDRAPG